MKDLFSHKWHGSNIDNNINQSEHLILWMLILLDVRCVNMMISYFVDTFELSVE